MNSDKSADWVSEVLASLKREDSFRKEGDKLLKIYEGESQRDSSYNILWANTETLLPTLLSNLPVPVVRRRFSQDASPIGKAVSAVIERSLAYFIDPAGLDQSSFLDIVSQSLVEALVPGRGQVRVKYDYTAVQGTPTMAGEVETSETDHPSVAEGEEADGHPTEFIQGENVLLVQVPWNKFSHSFARTWDNVWWVSFEHELTQKEVEELVGKDLSETLKQRFAVAKERPVSENNESSEKDQNTEPTLRVFEIWDKRTKQVRFVTEGEEDFLKVVPDPLQLVGFYPCPQPLSFINRSTTLIPKAPYTFYKEQAKELNRVSERITKIVEALKVRGLYDGQVTDFEAVLQLDDGQFKPARNSTMLAQGKGLDAAIWVWPLKDLVPVLQQLYTQRREIRQVIFEICGIADIMRGSTAASETLGAQELKTQWGTLRLKRSQSRVQEFVRSILRLMAQVVASHFKPKSIMDITQLKYPMLAEKQQVMAQMQEMGGQPNDPQLASMTQAVMSLPTWEEIFSVLKEQLNRSYLVDIETNSTVDVEATQDHKDLQEVLTALSQALQGISPLVQEGVMPFEAAKSILLTVCRKYRLGTDFEAELEKMKEAPPKQDPKAQADLQKTQMELQGMQQEHALRMKEMQQEAELRQQESAMRLQEMQQKHQLELQKMAMQLQSLIQEFRIEQQQSEMRMREVIVSAQATRHAQAGRQQNGRPSGKTPGNMQK